MIRKALYFFYDKEWNAEDNPFNTTLESLDENHAEFGQLGLRHLDHCIDSLRQSLQCSSDISPYVWQWSEEDGAVMGYADIIHTCRDFEAVSPNASRCGGNGYHTGERTKTDLILVGVRFATGLVNGSIPNI